MILEVLEVRHLVDERVEGPNVCLRSSCVEFK